MFVDTGTLHTGANDSHRAAPTPTTALITWRERPR
jgi:hypothetical protein